MSQDPYLEQDLAAFGSSWLNDAVDKNLDKFRNDRSGIDTTRAGPDEGWMSTLARAAENAAEMRLAEERRREEEERRKREQEAEMVRQRQEYIDLQTKKSQPLDLGGYEQYGDLREAIYGKGFDDTEKARIAVKNWAQTPDGARFLSVGGKEQIDYAQITKDPLGYFASNKEVRRSGYNETALTQAGVPAELVQGLNKWIETHPNGSKYRQAPSVSPEDAKKLSEDKTVSFMPDWFVGMSAKAQAGAEKYGKLSYGVRKQVAEERGVPGWAFEAIPPDGPRWGENPERDKLLQQLIDIDRARANAQEMEGFITKAARSATKAITPEGPIRDLATMLTAGTARGFEIAASGLAQVGLEGGAGLANLAGQEKLAADLQAAAERADVQTATNFRTNTWQQNVATGLVSASTLASLIIMAPVGKGIMPFLTRLGIDTGVNLMPNYVASGLFSGYTPEEMLTGEPMKDDEFRKSMLTNLAMIVGSGAVGTGAVGAGLRGAGQVPGGATAVRTAAGAGAGYGTAQLFGADREEAAFYAGLGGLAMAFRTPEARDALNRAIATVQGRAGKGPAFGLSIENVGGDDLRIFAPEWDPILASARGRAFAEARQRALAAGGELGSLPSDPGAWARSQGPLAAAGPPAGPLPSAPPPVAPPTPPPPPPVGPGSWARSQGPLGGPPSLPPGVIPFPTTAKMAEYITAARTGGALDTHGTVDALKAAEKKIKGEGGEPFRAVGSLVPGVPRRIIEFFDPSSKHDSQVQSAVLAGYNLRSDQAVENINRMWNIQSMARPLFGESGKRVLAREAVRFAPAAGGAAYGLNEGLDTEQGREALAGGLLASWAAHSRNIIKKVAPIDGVQFKGGVLGGSGVAAANLPEALKHGELKRAYVILHPDDFVLTPEQRAAAVSMQPILEASLMAVQAGQKWAGVAITPALPGARFFQQFTPESLEKAMPGFKDYFSGTSGKPDFLKPLPIELQRQLGKDVVDAVIKHPDLRLAGSVMELIARDLDLKVRQLGNDTTVKALTSGTEIKDGWIVDQRGALNEIYQQAQGDRDAWLAVHPEPGTHSNPAFMALDAKVNAARKDFEAAVAWEAANGIGLDWQPIPGVEGYRFKPSILETVRRLEVEVPGEFQNGFLGGLDKFTSDIRTAMFSADLSAWTMNGFMLAVRNPVGAIQGLFPALKASVLGERYVARWARDNREWLRRATQASVVPGVIADDLRMGAGSWPGRVPLVKQLEKRGFGNMLPVFRVEMFKHLSRMEALADSVAGGGKAKTAFGYLGGNDLVRQTMFAAQIAPAVAGVSLMAGSDDPWDRLFYAALAAGGTAAMGTLFEKSGKSALERMSATQRRSVENRVGKEINRYSGILNKAQMGITKEQGSFERTWMVRSPALTRNMLNMARLALTNTGPEGALARLYLVQTAVLLGGAALGVKLATGQGMDSFDPDDPDSILNPRGLGKAGFGAAGKATASNPTASLIRALFYHPLAEGEPSTSGFGFPSGMEDIRGAAGSLIAPRLPDITGQLYTAAFDAAGVGQNRPSPLTGTLKALGEEDIPRALGESFGRVGTPLPLQQAASSGFLAPIKGDPNVNTPEERALGPILAGIGLNFSADTLSQQYRREVGAAIQKQFPDMKPPFKGNPISRQDLPDAQREEFDASDEGKRLKAMSDANRELRKQQGQKETEADAYFFRSDEIRDEHVQNLRALEEAARADQTLEGRAYGLQAWRKGYNEEQKRYVEAKKTLKDDFSDPRMIMKDENGKPRMIWDPETKKAREMTIVEYNNRVSHPGDEAVDKYFSLYDAAKDSVGQTDFDALAKSQEEHKASLSPEVRAYLEQRLATFKERGVRDSEGNTVELPTLREYEAVKEAAKPYWDLKERVFPQLQKSNKYFQQFADYNDFVDQVAAKALASDMTTDAVLALVRKNTNLKSWEDAVAEANKKLRLGNPVLDYGLQDFYGSDAVNQLGYLGRKYDSEGIQKRGEALARSGQKLTAEEKDAWAKRFEAAFR